MARAPTISQPNYAEEEEDRITLAPRSSWFSLDDREIVRHGRVATQHTEAPKKVSDRLKTWKNDVKKALGRKSRATRNNQPFVHCKHSQQPLRGHHS
jgi:hypothetical protein